MDIGTTYGPAGLTDLVASGALPGSNRVLPLEVGTAGNAGFLAIPGRRLPRRGCPAGGVLLTAGPCEPGHSS